MLSPLLSLCVPLTGVSSSSYKDISPFRVGLYPNGLISTYVFKDLLSIYHYILKYLGLQHLGFGEWGHTVQPITGSKWKWNVEASSSLRPGLPNLAPHHFLPIPSARHKAQIRREGDIDLHRWAERVREFWSDILKLPALL